MKTKIAILLICSFLSSCVLAEDKGQIYTLFSQANEAFRTANTMTNTPQEAEKLYEKAILYYEKIINEYKIKNAKLYYNLANAYLMQNNLTNSTSGIYLGKAILNYRKAEKLDNSDTNIKKNLAFARSLRADKIEIKTEKKVMQTLFFWHYDFSVNTRFIVTSVSFAILCISLTIIVWRGKNTSCLTISTIASLLFICFLTSVIIEIHNQNNNICGVVTSKEIVAHQGDSENYPESFKDPLHQGTEFDMIEHRGGWFHIKLSDNSDGWIPDNAAETI
ncbi:MAG TPA: tetratricopeptide repeat protein [Sedimentisphaerales bacterium]|nr:tetratricopeptide repeat protein [Sedimentisphaerales bacterium]